LNKAIEIAAKAHIGQVDKGGNPYILHPLRVMMNFCGSESEAVKICAVLHDVAEDTDVTLDDLQAEGFSEDIISALDCLTKRDAESYDEFISRVLTDEIACKVKNGDLADNMDLTRIPNPTEKDKQRVKKYRDAAARIMDVLPEIDGKTVKQSEHFGGSYRQDELIEAHRALSSTLHKCEKIDGDKMGKSQQTLLERRITALKIALNLIEKEQKYEL